MSEADPPQSNSDRLREYVALSIAQSNAADVFDTSRYNRLAFEISEIARALRRGPHDERHLLETLLDHPNLQVRFNAATHLMPIMPKQARRQIEAIADSKGFPIAGTAGTYLIMLDMKR